MKLTKTQIELLEGIQSNLRRGDISRIAKNIGLTREYVGMVLNPGSTIFNESVIAAAVELIAFRKQNTIQFLKR